MATNSWLTRMQTLAHSGYAERVVRALDRWRLAAVALTTLLLSLAALGSPALLDFFSPAEIALAWLEHLLELGVIGLVLMLAYTFVDEALPRRLPGRLAVIGVMLLVLAGVLAWLLYAYYAHGFAHLPPPLRLLADSLRWGLPAVFLALIADVHARALQADSAAHAVELSRAQGGHGETEQQLALLQAQIEPHFLFNVLGSVRRLYRTQPQAGAEAIASLMGYLRTALPQARLRNASLGDELESVRSYLALFQVRMGSRLRFSVDADPDLNAAEFPPMLLITLVENAIRHGLEPAGGGSIRVSAQRQRNGLEITVQDDGVGFGGAASSGTGVGLVNVRRQLAARYPNQARLGLQSLEPRGARVSISMPLRIGEAGRIVPLHSVPA
jgi:signal transduction histidine kinase